MRTARRTHAGRTERVALALLLVPPVAVVVVPALALNPRPFYMRFMYS